MLQQSDTLVSVPIKSIRDANRKLIERNELLEIVAEQDTIIMEYTKLVELQDRNLDMFIEENDSLSQLNESLYNKLNHKKNWNNVLIGTTSISVLGLIVSLLIH